MLTVSNAYKQQMDKRLRNHSYMMVSIGAINQLAQKNASIASDTYYLSNNQMLFDNYLPQVYYATLEQNWMKCDGSMLFPERKEVIDSTGGVNTLIFNQGAISNSVLGAIQIAFATAYDIKGLTIDFGVNYPTDFTMTNGTVSYTYSGNTKSYWETDNVFDGSTYLTITPTAMVNGQDRLRIQKMFMGIGILFDSKKLKSVKCTDTQSPITEDIPTIDVDVTVENYDKKYDVNNKASEINYLEIGQDVTTKYGYEMDDGSVYWIDGGVTNLKSWSADDKELTFSSQDKISDLTETYYGGEVHSEGITLYDLAVLVFEDAGVDQRDYEIDEYLKKVTVYNPLPNVPHNQCLQIIANAGRCKLYQTRDGKIAIKAAFATEISPERMQISSSDATDYSNLRSVITGMTQYQYALLTKDYFKADGSMYFLPRDTNYLVTGFVSTEVSDANGAFTTNPKVTIVLESAGSFYSFSMNFASNPPTEVILHSYLSGVLKGDYTVSNLSLTNTISHEFPEMDTLVIEFTKAPAYNRIYLSNFAFGDVTDYSFTKEIVLETPKGSKDDRIKEVQIVKTVYTEGTELQNISTNTVDVTGMTAYTFYFSQPSHGVTVTCDGTTLSVNDVSAYFVTVDVSSYTGSHEFIVTGYTYNQTETTYVQAINTTGETKQWKNPLISEDTNAALVGQWIGDYYANNINYEISYRGEPRIEAGDLAFLENDFVDNLMIQIVSHDLSYGGTLSGSVKARLAQ